jgi:hypothetical protein
MLDKINWDGDPADYKTRDGADIIAFGRYALPLPRGETHWAVPVGTFPRSYYFNGLYVKSVEHGVDIILKIKPMPSCVVAVVEGTLGLFIQPLSWISPAYSNSTRYKFQAQRVGDHCACCNGHGIMIDEGLILGVPEPGA